jgi:hypothetical protein
MTQGLLISRLRKIKLCKLSIKTPSLANVGNYKKFRNLYNIIVRKSKRQFYDQRFEINKRNFRKTWSLLYEVIKKSKNKGLSINCLLLDGNNVTDPSQNVNIFNHHLATLKG